VSSWSFAGRALSRVAGPRVLDAKAFFSPRDDFIAYTSQESGRPEVYVATFPEHRQTWLLTTGGGQVIGWRRDGGEILVATLSGHIVAYPVTTEGGFSHGEPATLVRNLGSLVVYDRDARPQPHAHSRQPGRGTRQGRDAVALWESTAWDNSRRLLVSR
jgi:hypothetical protein